MLQTLYYKLFDAINNPLDLTDCIFWIGLFTSLYFTVFLLFNSFSEKFRSLESFNKKIHIVLQSLKFSNKIVVNVVTLGCLLLWDERLLYVEHWNNYKDIFYNLSSLFAWSDVVALIINRSSMTVLCQLHHAGVVIAYLYVINTSHLGDGLFRACIMYGVFAASAFFHNFYSVIKNICWLSEETDLTMNRISHLGMLASNLINWSWQVVYLSYLTLGYLQSGNFLVRLPALSFYFIFFVIFVKESCLMISHFRLTKVLFIFNCNNSTRSKQAERKLH